MKKNYFSATLNSLRCERRADVVTLVAVDSFRSFGVRNVGLSSIVPLGFSFGMMLVLARRVTIFATFGVVGATFGDRDVDGDASNANATLFALRKLPGVFVLMILRGVLATDDNDNLCKSEFSLCHDHAIEILSL